VRAEGAIVVLEDLLPRETWVLILAFTMSSKFEGYIDELVQLKQLRASCVLFSHLCLEHIAEINVVSFSKQVLLFVLLARPHGLRRISMLEYRTLTSSVLFILFRQLASATQLEKIDLNLSESVVQGSLLCAIGESCISLKSLSLSVGTIQGPFDSPVAFAALEYLKLDVVSLHDSFELQAMTTTQRRLHFQPPNFANFPRLFAAQGVLWNYDWALALSDAPCLQCLSDGNRGLSNGASGACVVYLSDKELGDFFSACKRKPISTSLKSLQLTDYDSNPRKIGDDTTKALLDAFPNLEQLKIEGTRLSLSLPFLEKLKAMQHIKKLDFRNNDWPGPSRPWLEVSCRLFPRSLKILVLKSQSFRTNHSETEFIHMSFRSCLELDFISIDDATADDDDDENDFLLP